MVHFRKNSNKIFAVNKILLYEMNTAEVEVCVGDTIQNLNETIRLYHITIKYKDDNKMDKTIFSLTTDFNILKINHKKTKKKLNLKLKFGIFFSTNEENCEKEQMKSKTMSQKLFRNQMIQKIFSNNWDFRKKKM